MLDTPFFHFFNFFSLQLFSTFLCRIVFYQKTKAKMTISSYFAVCQHFILNFIFSQNEISNDTLLSSKQPDCLRRPAIYEYIKSFQKDIIEKLTRSLLLLRLLGRGGEYQLFFFLLLSFLLLFFFFFLSFFL